MKKQIDAYNYTVKNSSDDKLDIYIDGGIVDAETHQILKDWYGDETSTSFKSFRDTVLDSGAAIINVHINSGGGHVGDAMAIHDLLQKLKGDGKTVNTFGTGIVASAATYPLMAGSVVEMSENSFFMIHNVSGGVYGDVEYVENYARSLRKFNDIARDFYASASGQTAKEVEKMMSAETWMTASEAKEKGFINKVSGKQKFSNTIKPEDWQYSNKAILNSYNAQVKNQDETPNLIQVIENSISEKFETMKKFFAENFGNKAKDIKPAEGATPVDITNQVTTALTASLEEFETEIGNTLDQGLVDIKNELTTSFDQRLADLETANNLLKEQNLALTTTVANMAGGATFVKQEAAPKQFGSFSTGTE